MLELFVSWATITVLLIIALITRWWWTSRELDWIPLKAAPGDIEQQVTLERKAHRLDPVVHWLEGINVALLISLGVLWIWRGINTVRW